MNTTILIFGSGKLVITGGKTYQDLIKSKRKVKSELEEVF
jgi:TATA-box binding protein (TBP) (component of TFIID and TFIIIB)